MRKIFTILVLMFVCGWASAQITGTKTIPGNYANIAAAISAINTSGVGDGGVTFNVAAGHTETFASPTAGLITAAGTAANPIVFQKSGAGANPVITAGIGTSTTVDGIIVIAGGDYITFDGINLAESGSNATATTQMEWGYAIVKESATDGAKNITIKNCTITLNKANVATKGIYGGNHLAANTSALIITTNAGINANIKINGCTVTYCYNPISINGYTSDVNFYDTGLEIGSTTTNTISNYGGGSSSYTYGIYVDGQNSPKIENNSVTSGSGTTSRVYGIMVYNYCNGAIEINTNTVSVSSSATSSYMYGIVNFGRYATTVKISNNIVKDCVFSTAHNANFRGITEDYAGSNCSVTITGNTIDGLTYSGGTGLAGSGSVYGIYESMPVASITASNNIIKNISMAGTSGCTFYGMYISGNLQTISNNSIFSNTISGTGTYGEINGIYSYTNSNTPNTVVCSGNTIYGNNIINALGVGAIYGIRNPNYSAYETYSNNQIYNLANSGYGSVYGIYANSTLVTKTISGNTLYGLSSAGSVFGICQNANSSVISKNNIYNLATYSTGSSISVSGIYVSGGLLVKVYNNLISDLKAPSSTNPSAIQGMYITGGISSLDYVYYNTVYLNAASTGTTFGTSGINANIGPLVDLRNNIIINKSTPAGTGKTVAYRRSSTDLSMYASTSNNNCFYAGTPSLSNLIFYDGTNSDQTLAAFQTRAGARDNLSVTEDVPFINGASAPYNLHINTATATQLEGGGTAIATPFAVTDDFDGGARNGSTPDIGADEFSGTQLDNTAPAIAYSNLANSSILTSPTFGNVVITDARGVNFTAGTKPRAYYKKSTEADTYAGNTTANNGWKFVETTSGSSPCSFTLNLNLLNSAAAIGDVIQYFIVAQDVTPNVAINSGSFNAAPASVALTSAAFPIGGSINSYTLVSNISGTKTVGTGGDYSTIAAAIADLNANGVGSGGVTFNVAAGHTETFATPTTGLITNLTSSESNPVVFQKSGSGANPLVTAAVGASTTVDGIILIAGGDYITFDGIDLKESDLNTDATMQMEWGYAIVKASATEGSQNITIRNCTVTLNKTNAATKGIYGGNHLAADVTPLTITATSGKHANIKIYGCTVTNCYKPIYFNGPTFLDYYDTGLEIGTGGANTLTNYGGGFDLTSGIYLNGQNAPKIENNTVTLGTGSTGNTYGIFIDSKCTGNHKINANTVSVSSRATDMYLYGIYNGAPISTTLDITNNIIQNCDYATATGGRMCGIFDGGANAARTVNITGNTIDGFTYSASGLSSSANVSGIWESNQVAELNVNNNTIKNCNMNNGSGGVAFTAIKMAGGINQTASNNIIFNNKINNNTAYGQNVGISTGSASVVVMNSNTIHDNSNIYGNVTGINVSGTAANETYTNNNIYNLANTGGPSATAAGFNASTSSNNTSRTVSGNTIYTLSSLGSVYGIYESYANTNLFKNKVYDLTSTGDGSATGIWIYYANTVYVYNNFISDIKAPNATSTQPAVAGIRATDYSSSYNGYIGAWFNTIYLNATGTVSAFGSAGIYSHSDYSLDLRNNIVGNNSTPGASGKTVAYWRSNSTLTKYATTSNNNSFYAGTPSATNLIFWDGTNADQTLTDFKNRMITRDQASVTENVAFENMATTPYDLHVKTTVATLLDDAGTPVTAPIAVTNDYDNALRNVSTPDIGAHEFEYSPPIPVKVTASLGTISGGYTTLKAAFDAINLGTHQGVITIAINENITETASAKLNASGVSTFPGISSYSSVNIYPTATGLTIGGNLATAPLIDLKGADSVTIDGRVNQTGLKDLTITNTSTSATAGTSTIRFIDGATNDTIKNCNVQGSATMGVATAGATILFSTDALTANGNDNNTISNCDIGPAGANLPTKAILGNGSTTTTAIGNSGNVITNNDIHDYFGAAVSSSGIATLFGCNTWTITSNRFYQTATRTWTTGSTHTAISINNNAATSGAQGFTITGNIIGYASNTQTGTYTLTGSTGKFTGINFYGFTGGTVSNINSNTIASVSLTGVTSNGALTSSPFTAILVRNGVANTNSNTIGSQSATGSLTYSTTTTTSTIVYGILNYSADDWTANNNNIGGISVTNLDASGLFAISGLVARISSSKMFNATSNNIGGTIANSIQLTSTGAASQVIGIQTYSAIGGNLTSNTVRNLTNNNGTGTSTGASVIGMSLYDNFTNHTVSQNTIYNLSNTHATAATVVTGIQFIGSTENIVNRNFIYGLSATSASASLYGINIIGGTTTYSNNIITLNGDNSSYLYGINDVGGTNKVYFNTVYIDGSTPSGVNRNSYCLYSNGSNVRDYRNNIFVNNRFSGIINPCVYINNLTNLTIDYNDYYYFIYAAANQGVGMKSSQIYTSLANFQGYTGQDTHSKNVNPGFASAGGVLPANYLPSESSLVAVTGTGIPKDCIDTTRSVTYPAMGAWEYTITPPCTNPTNGGTIAANQNSCAAFDPVQITNSALPSGESGTLQYQWQSSTDNISYTDLSTGTYTATTYNPDLVSVSTWYKRLARVGCMANWTGAAASNAVKMAVNSIPLAPTGASVQTYNITLGKTLTDLTGTLTGSGIKWYSAASGGTLYAGTEALATQSYFASQTVDGCESTLRWEVAVTIIYPVEVVASDGTPTGAYTTLFAAFNSINMGTHQGVITIKINASTNEIVSAKLNASGVSTFPGISSYSSVTIYPTITGLSISGNIATAPLIDLNGADSVTIDGRVNQTGLKDLTITNTSTSATAGTSTIRFINGATNDTIKNCIVQGSATMAVATEGATILFSTDGLTANGNDNNTISNCDIGPAGANLPTKAILGNGSSISTAKCNSGNVITNNDIHDYFGAAVTSSGIATIGGCNTWTITNNRFYQTASRTWTTGAAHRAIDINNSTSAQGFTITGNIIGYASNTQTGTYTLTGSTGGFTGIYFWGKTNGTVSNINSNTIASVSMTGVTSSGIAYNSPFTAILVRTGLANTNSNNIGSQSAIGSLTFSTTTTTETYVYGIFNYGGDNWTANSNNIGSISVTNLGASGTFSIYGLKVNTSSSMLFNATSNNIGGTIANSIQLTSTGASSQVVGIHVAAAIGNLTSNTVRNLTNNNGTGTAATASAIGMSLTTSSANHTVSQNTIYNLSNTHATAATVVTGIEFTGSTANIVNRNFIYGLSATSASASLYGINITGGTTTYSNNIITLNGDNSSYLYGINDVAGTSKVYFNTVYIYGSTPTGVNKNSYCLYSNGSNVRNYRNNIFVNNRFSGYINPCVYINDLTNLTIDYNDYYYFITAGANQGVGMSSSQIYASLTLFQNYTGKDSHSKNANPIFASAGGVLAANYLPSSLSLAGVTGTGITTDYDSASRSLTIPAMGAWEYTLCTAPAITSQSTAGNTQCLNGTFAAITVTATGDSLNYQWYKNTTADTTGGITVGTNSNSYTPLADTSGTRYYYCKVTGTCGIATSVISGAFVTPATTRAGAITGESLSFHYTGSFGPTTMLGGIPLGVSTPFSIVATFNRSSYVPEMIGAGFYKIESFSINIQGYGTFGTLSSPDLTVGLFEPTLDSSYIAGISNTSHDAYFANNFQSAIPNFLASNPVSSVLSDAIQNQVSNPPLVIALVGVTGGLVINDFGSGTISAELIETIASQKQCVGGAFSPITVIATGDSLNYQWYKNTTADTIGGVTVGTDSINYTPLATTSGTLYYYCKVTGTCGTALSEVSGAFVTNSLTPPPAPTANDTTIYYGSAVTIYATGTGTGTLGWYDAATGGNWLYGGGSFTIPVLTNDTTYYVQDSVCTESATRTAVNVNISDICVSDTAGVITFTISDNGTSISDLHTSLSANILTITAGNSQNRIALASGISAGISGNYSSTVTVDLNTFSSFAGISVIGGTGTDNVAIGSGGVDLASVPAGAAAQSVHIEIGSVNDQLTIANAITAKGTGNVYLRGGLGYSIGGLLSADTLTIISDSTVTQTAAISANRLILGQGTFDGGCYNSITNSGTYTLTNSSNNVSNFMACTDGSIHYTDISGVAINGKGAKVGGDFTLTAGGHLEVAECGLIIPDTTGNVILSTTSGAILIKHGGINAGGNVTLTSADSTITINDNGIVSLGKVIASSYKNIIAGANCINNSSGKGVDLTSTIGSVQIKDVGLRSKGAVNVVASGAVTIESGGIDNSFGTGDLSITSSSDTVATSGSGIQSKGKITVLSYGNISAFGGCFANSSGTGVDLTSTNGKITLGGSGLNSMGEVKIVASGTVASSGGGINNTMGTSNLTVTSTNGPVTSMDNGLLSKGKITVLSYGNILASGSGIDNLPGTGVDLTSTNGSVNLQSGTLYSEGEVKAVASGAITVQSGGIINSSGTGNLSLTSSTDTIFITDGGLQSKGKVMLSAHKNITVSTGGINNSSGTGVDITSINGAIRIIDGGLTSKGDVNVLGYGAIYTASGGISNTTGTGDISITSSAGSFANGSGGTVSSKGNIVVSTFGNILITSGGIGNTSGTGTIGIESSNGTISIQEAGVTSRNAISVVAYGNITMTNNGVNNTSGTGSINLHSNNGTVSFNEAGANAKDNAILCSDKVTISGPSLTSLGKKVTIFPANTNVAINLGGSDGTGILGISNPELNNIQTDTVSLGDTVNTASITVSSKISDAIHKMIFITNPLGGISLSDSLKLKDVDLSQAHKYSTTILSRTSAQVMCVSGSVNLGTGTVLDISTTATGFIVGDSIKIIDNTLEDPISGTFSGLAQKDIFSILDGASATVYLKISYSGGDGNDVMLKVTDIVPTVAWDNTNPDIFDPITSTTATATAIIADTNAVIATNRGAIVYPYTDTDKTIGEADVINESTGGNFGTGSYPVSLTALTPNTRYNARAHATNSYGTGYSNRTDFWTLANIPSPPTVINPSATTLDVAVNSNGNPSATIFAIQDSVNNLYVKTDGTRGADTLWQTAAAWDTITVTGLSTGVTYYFRVKAKNGNDVETAFGKSTGQNTCSNPTVGGTIGTNQTICYGTKPSVLTNVALPSTYGGTLEYKWQYSTPTDSLIFTDIDHDSVGYAPGNLNNTTWYKRVARVSCKNNWTGAAESNVVKIIVHPQFAAGNIKKSGETICYNGNPTQISDSISASGGNGAISYQWQSSTDNITYTDLSTGTYTSTTYIPDAGHTTTTWYSRSAKDATCNTSFITSAGIWKVTVNPQLFSSAYTNANVDCYSNNTGSVEVSVSGGTSNYEYAWSTEPAQTTALATGLTTGTYSVTVTDANLCSTTSSTIVTQPDALTATASLVANVSIYQGSDGSVTVSSGGGTTPYSYKWSSTPQQTAQTATGLSAGTYWVTVTDAHTCSATSSVLVTQPTPPTVQVTTVVVTDIGSTQAVIDWTRGNGSGCAVFVMQGNTGTAPPTNNVSYPADTVFGTPASQVGTTGWYCVYDSTGTHVTVTGLAPSTDYMVHICEYKLGSKTYNTGSSPTNPAYYATYPALLASITVSENVSCNGLSDGTATVSVSGGNPSYGYLWSTVPAQTAQTATGLSAGTYTVTITDGVSATITSSIAVSQPDVLEANASISKAITCHQGSDGGVTVSVSGGTTAYSYSWSTLPIQSAAVATGLTVGTYSVTVSDANGCIASSSALLTQPIQWWPELIGPTPVCQNSTGNVYTTDAGMTLYAWLVSAGGTITSGGTGTDSTVIITWSGFGPQTVSVNYKTPSGCVAVEPTVKDVDVNIAPTPILTGEANVTQGQVVTYSTPYNAGNSYSWNASHGNPQLCFPYRNCLTLTWDFPCGVINPGFVRVTETIVSTGCSTTVTKWITIAP